MFAGGVLVAGALAMALALGTASRRGHRRPPPPWVLGALVLSVLFLLSNLALQYGAARLPANVTAVVMLTEVRRRRRLGAVAGRRRVDAAAADRRRADRCRGTTRYPVISRIHAVPTTRNTARKNSVISSPSR